MNKKQGIKKSWWWAGSLLVLLGMSGCYQERPFTSCKICLDGKCGENPEYLRAMTEQQATEEAIQQLRGQGVDRSSEEFKKVVPVCKTTFKNVPMLFCSPH